MDYDPNLTNSGQMAKQRVRLTFAQWKYRTTREVVIGGNCTGLSVIDSAVETVLEDLEYTEYEGREYSRITLEDGDGNTLEYEDEDCRCDDWLKDMLIAAEIVEIVPADE